MSAGRSRATKLILRGSALARGAARSDRVSSEHVVWYAPDVRRIVKYSVSTRVGASLQDGTVFDLTDDTLN